MDDSTGFDDFDVGDDFGIGPEGDGWLDEGEAMADMYQEFILEQSRHPQGKRDLTESAPRLDSPAEGSALHSNAHGCLSQSHQFNPTCGDEVTVRVGLSNAVSPTIESVEWDGHGCAISQASLSVMVTMVRGHTVADFEKKRREFHSLMNSRGRGLSDPKIVKDLGDAMAFQGVSRFPMRIKCALLGWEGVRDAVAKALPRLGG